MSGPIPRNRKSAFERLEKAALPHSKWPWHEELLAAFKVVSSAYGGSFYVVPHAVWSEVNIQTGCAPDNLSFYQRRAVWLSDAQEEWNVIHELAHWVECGVRRPGRLRNVNWASYLDEDRYPDTLAHGSQSPESLTCSIEVAWGRAKGCQDWLARAKFLNITTNLMGPCLQQGREFLEAAGIPVETP